MKKILAFLLIAAASTAFSQSRDEPTVYRFDPALDAIVAPGTKVAILADSPATSRTPDTREGPLWIRKGGYLLYTVLGDQKINRWDPRTNTVSTFLEKCQCDGMTLDPQGRVLWAGGAPPDNPQAGGAVMRLEADGTRTPIAKEYDGKPLSNPNDLVFKSNGVLYFSDLSMKDPSRIFMLKDGKPQLLLADKRLLGGGLAFSPDERYLYLTANQLILRFEVRADGTIDNGTVFIDYATYKRPEWPQGFADGLKVDRKGNVYCTGPGGLWIISPQGKPLGTILNLNAPANLNFGGADGKTLFITSRPGLHSIRLKVAGRVP